MTAFLGCLTARCDSDETKETAPGPTQSIPVQGWTPPRKASDAPSDAAREAAPPKPTSDAAHDDLASYATAAPVSGKSVGHTSVVFKLKLDGGLEAAYKPRSKRGPARYKGEIAAYRLATALGLANVPPALSRSFARAMLMKALGGETNDAGALFAKEAIATDAGEVPGALIPWIPHLELMELHTEPLLSAWHGWLGGAQEVPEDQRGLAAQVSTMIVFDYITGNWDRWSGGNIGFQARQKVLLFLDNDGAFYDVPPEGPLAAQKGRLNAVTRFSRGFVGRLRTLDPKSLAAAMGEESPGVPLLGEKAISGVNARRGEALRIIDARIEKSGAEKVLDFE